MYCNECGNSLPDGVERCPVCGSKVKVQYANNGMNDFNNGQKNDPVQNQYQNDRMGYVNNNYGEDSSLSGIVLSENEQLVRQYHCSSVKQPRCLYHVLFEKYADNFESVNSYPCFAYISLIII